MRKILYIIVLIMCFCTGCRDGHYEEKPIPVVIRDLSMDSRRIYAKVYSNDLGYVLSWKFPIEMKDELLSVYTEQTINGKSDKVIYITTTVFVPDPVSPNKKYKKKKKKNNYSY